MIIDETITAFESPLGYIIVSGTEKGISSITFCDDKPAYKKVDLHPCMHDCVDQLRSYFEGRSTKFHSIALRYPATEFQLSVWDTLMEVPFGETLTYGELAERSGNKGAHRAVGTAMNSNPLPIIIPCHRVLPASGGIGGYGSGVHRKEWLLSHEKWIGG